MPRKRIDDGDSRSEDTFLEPPTLLRLTQADWVSAVHLIGMDVKSRSLVLKFEGERLGFNLNANDIRRWTR